MGNKGWWHSLTLEQKEAFAERQRESYWKARAKCGYITVRKKAETLCWSCQRAVKECPWSANFEPVEGWVAEPTKIMSSHYPIDSFFVKECPLYEPDQEPIPEGGTNEGEQTNES